MSSVGTATPILHDVSRSWPIESQSAACVSFSPPYNVGIDYDDDDSCDQMPWPEYRAMALHVMQECQRTLIEGGRVFVNITPSVPEVARPAGNHSGQASAARINLVGLWASAAEQAGLKYRDTIAWVTEGRGPGCAWGSYESPAGPNMRGEWEAILCFSQGPWARKTPAEHKGWKDSEGEWPRLVSNVWKVKPEPDRTHPAPFPIGLASRCIRLSTFPGETVIDPFCGSGTTLLAARNLGRHGIGFDRSQKYIDMASTRLAQLTMFGAVS